MSGLRHYSDELQALLDGRLDSDTAQQLTEHLESCDQCRAEQQQLQSLRESFRAAGDPPMPQDLQRNILAALDAEPEMRGAEDLAQKQAPRWRFGWRAAAALAILSLGVFATLQWRSGEPRIAEVSKAVIAFQDGLLPLDVRTAVPAELQEAFRARGVRFPTRVLDLQMMGYQLLGGAKIKLANAPSALFVYRGPGNENLICQMFEGVIGPFVKNASVREHNGIQFFIHKVGRVTEVFWAEGDVICVLASTANAEDVIALAKAKAMMV